MKRATIFGRTLKATEDISIHALYEEGDRSASVNGLTCSTISIHALYEEGDANRQKHIYTFQISIHALYEEGDSTLLINDKVDIVFQSTPSMKRATAVFVPINMDYARFQSTPSMKRATAKFNKSAFLFLMSIC